jgi:glycosyltransferase involved in cell wall biosynthesis
MRRRVLILCYFFPPLAGGGVHRVLGFTRWLPAHGWDCTVVCAGAGDYWVTDPTLEARVPAETEVIRVPGGSALSAWLKVRGGDRGRRPGGTFAALRRLSDWWLLPDSYAGWAARARRAAARRLDAGGIHALLSSSPPDSVHLAARPLARRFAVPWVADFRDPWIGLAFRTPPTAWHRARQAAMERDVVEGADLVLAASRTHAENVGRWSGAVARRVALLPNGFEPDAPESGGRAGAPVPAAEAMPAFRVVYTGTLSQMPDAEVFLDAVHEVLARHTAARRTLRVTFAGPFDSGVEDRAVALGLTGIVGFLGPVGHAESRRLQRAADLLLLWKPRGVPTMVPGKLYEYLDAGRPLLAVLDEGDEAARLAADAGAERVAPGDRAGIAAALERRWEAWSRGERPGSARPAWLVGHTRAGLAGRLATELDALAGRRP